MPDWIAVIILGIIEGITEFIPISSTAHLVLASRVMYLSLTPEQAQVLASIQQTAKTVRASLRPIGDADQPEIKDYDEIVYE